MRHVGVHAFFFLVGVLLPGALSSSLPCIPVLGFGVMKDPKNFAGRLITHVDFCVDNFILVMGSQLASSNFKSAVMSWTKRSAIKNVTLIERPHALIGVAETWNIIVSTFPSAPWYAISAYDVTFRTGQLQEFNRRFWKESGLLHPNGKKLVNFAHTKWENLPGGKGFNFFALSREVVDNVGYFDENLFPAFWEDRDYQYRLRLWSGAKVKSFRTIKLWHGEDCNEKVQCCGDRGKCPHLELQNVDTPNSKLNASMLRPKKHFNYTSGTIYLGKSWTETMRVATNMSLDYLMRKWNCNRTLTEMRHHLMECHYLRPFGDANREISDWELNNTALAAIRALYDNEDRGLDSTEQKPSGPRVQSSLPKNPKLRFSFSHIKEKILTAQKRNKNAFKKHPGN